MKKLIGILALGLVACTTGLQAEVTGMDSLKSFMQKEMEKTVAIHHKANVVETHVIQYTTLEDGSLVHVGVWTDCVIATVVGNSPNIGTQIIVLSDGQMYDGSNKWSKHSKYFKHKYKWGEITSYDYKQIIKKY